MDDQPNPTCPDMPQHCRREIHFEVSEAFASLEKRYELLQMVTQTHASSLAEISRQTVRHEAILVRLETLLPRIEVKLTEIAAATQSVTNSSIQSDAKTKLVTNLVFGGVGALLLYVTQRVLSAVLFK